MTINYKPSKGAFCEKETKIITIAKSKKALALLSGETLTLKIIMVHDTVRCLMFT